MFEVLWAARRRSIDARTDLHEALMAGTIIAYATPEVIDEVVEYLPARASERNLDPQTCFAELSLFQLLLRVCRPPGDFVEIYIGGVDPDDAPTLALADFVDAIGVFSHDKHIKKMGGTPVRQDFILEMHDYSRKIAISVSIKAGGYYFSIGVFRLY